MRAQELAGRMLMALGGAHSLEIVAACYEVLALTAGHSFQGTAEEAWASMAGNETLRAAFIQTFGLSKETPLGDDGSN